MINRNQIHSLTSNFPILQGLRAVPISMFLLIVVIWANQQTGSSRDLTLMIVVSVAMGMFYWFVDRYYKLAFGSVEQTTKKKTTDYAISAAAGAVGLACFILDSALELPFSILGLLWSVLLVFDGFRIARALPRKTFPFFWVFATILALVSLLPLMGFHNWWLTFGFQDQSLAVMAAVSLVTLVNGYLWHTYFVRNLEIGDGS